MEEEEAARKPPGEGEQVSYDDRMGTTLWSPGAEDLMGMAHQGATVEVQQASLEARHMSKAHAQEAEGAL